MLVGCASSIGAGRRPRLLLRAPCSGRPSTAASRAVSSRHDVSASGAAPPLEARRRHALRVMGPAGGASASGSRSRDDMVYPGIGVARSLFVRSLFSSPRFFISYHLTIKPGGLTSSYLVHCILTPFFFVLYVSHTVGPYSPISSRFLTHHFLPPLFSPFPPRLTTPLSLSRAALSSLVTPSLLTTSRQIWRLSAADGRAQIRAP